MPSRTEWEIIASIPTWWMGTSVKQVGGAVPGKDHQEKEKPSRRTSQLWRRRKASKSELVRGGVRSIKASRKCTGQRHASKNVCMQQEFQYWEFVGRRNDGVARLFGQGRTSQISEHVRSKCGKTTGTAAGLECRQDILLSVGLFLSFRIPGHFNPAPASGGDGGGSCLGSRVVLPKQGQVGGTA